MPDVYPADYGTGCRALTVPDLQAEADRRYALIMGEVAASA